MDITTVHGLYKQNWGVSPCTRLLAHASRLPKHEKAVQHVVISGFI